MPAVGPPLELPVGLEARVLPQSLPPLAWRAVAKVLLRRRATDALVSAAPVGCPGDLSGLVQIWTVANDQHGGHTVQPADNETHKAYYRRPKCTASEIGAGQSAWLLDNADMFMSPRF
jgi:hypothetical protein